jgi:2-iminobutanoate/2-iminopropanoate deaminase
MTSAGIQTLNPDTLGAAIAPYSQATIANGFCFISGQVALDQNNEVVAHGDARAQTVVVLERMETILAEVGATLTDVVTTTVWLTEPRDQYAAFNEAWAEKFGDHRPARAVVKSPLLFDGLTVEVQATAALPS